MCASLCYGREALLFQLGGGQMSKNLELKKQVVEEIKEKFEKAQSAILVDYRGLNVFQVTNLRKTFREAGVEYKVYKNNLVKLAIKDTPYEALANDLEGPNGIAFGVADPIIPVKIISDFAKTNPKLELKSGVVVGRYYDSSKISEIANIPSKEVLIARFLGSIKSPVSNFVYFLSNLAEKKEA
jgi:large subunit ribosomal protein L10